MSQSDLVIHDSAASTKDAAVKTKSADKIELQFFYNGQQGDEGAMVGKMKAGLSVVVDADTRTMPKN